MKVDIAVVEYEGEFWFELGGVKFDTLSAIWEFDHRNLEVTRNGGVVARARVHEARGEPIFYDYVEGGAIRLSGSALHAEDFALGDSLTLDVSDEFDLVSHLRRSCWFLSGMIATVPVGEEMSLGELLSRMNPELARTEQTATASQILRFRRGR